MRQAELIRSQCPELEAFLIRTNPDRSFASKRGNPDLPTLLAINEAFNNPMAAIAWLAPRLLRLSEFVGTRQKFTPNQVRWLASDIASRYGYLDMGEIDDFFSRLRAGEFGTFYGADDPQFVLASIRRYLTIRGREVKAEEDRQRAAERERHSREAISWQQFAAERGLDPSVSPIDLLTQ